VFSKVNISKLEQLWKEHNNDFALFKLREFLLNMKVPQIFEEKKSFRVTAIIPKSMNLTVEELPCKFGTQVSEGLKMYENGKANRHYCVLSEILEEPSNNVVATEVPIWKFRIGAKPVCGHIDMLEYEKPCVYIWDYKPDALQEDARAQVYFYKRIFCDLLGLNYDLVKCGWFDAERMFVVKET
jgi:hypothetical protein